MKIIATSFKIFHVCIGTCVVPPILQEATANTRLHWRFLDTHRQVWVSLLCGHCSFLLGPAAHKVLFVPSKSLFPQTCVSSGVLWWDWWRLPPRGLMPYPGLLHPEPLQQSTSDLYLCRRHSNTVLSQSLWGLWVLVHTRFVWALFEHLWQVWGLILNAILPFLPSCWGLSFALGCGVSPQLQFYSCFMYTVRAGDNEPASRTYD